MKACIDIDPVDVLPAVDDGALLDECHARGIAIGGHDAEELAEELRAAFLSRDRAHFEVLLGRLDLVRVPSKKASHRAAEARA